MKRVFQISTFCLLLVLSPHSVQGWGEKGHRMAGRVAAQGLPADMPLFFRAAVDRLSYLIPEPDRWRGVPWGGLKGDRIELTNLTASNHNIRMELLRGIPFPQTRFQYIAMALERGLVPRDTVDMHRLGSVFYAMVEDLQLLTTQLRLWREAQEASHLDPTGLMQIQENAIYAAGVLGHWITDSAQPLHTTVHSDDWDSHYPNPKNYQSKDIHGRFEAVYVDQVITEKDIALRLTPVRVLGDWRDEAEAHLRRSFGHFEEIYAMDQQGAFGSGKEPAGAHEFTATRLGAGASMLRDAWYSAWKKSEEELLNSPVRLRGVKGRSILDLLSELKKVEISESEAMKVVAIGHRRNGMEGRQWLCTVNGNPLIVSADKYVTSDLESIEWRFVGKTQQSSVTHPIGSRTAGEMHAKRNVVIRKPLDRERACGLPHKRFVTTAFLRAHVVSSKSHRREILIKWNRESAMILPVLSAPVPERIRFSPFPLHLLAAAYRI